MSREPFSPSRPISTRKARSSVSILTAASDLHGFLLGNGVFTTINVPGANLTIATTGSTREASSWVSAVEQQRQPTWFSAEQGCLYDHPDFPGATLTVASGINSGRRHRRGTILTAAATRHAYLLSKGAFTTIDFPGAGGDVGLDVEGINPQGDIVGFYERQQR